MSPKPSNLRSAVTNTGFKTFAVAQEPVGGIGVGQRCQSNAHNFIRQGGFTHLFGGALDPQETVLHADAALLQQG